MLRHAVWATLAVALLSVPAAGQANGLTGPGTATYVNTQWGWFPCSGVQCTPATGASNNQITGAGQSSTRDSSGLQAPGDPSGSAQAVAQAQLIGPLGVPVLKTYVGGAQGLGTPPGYQGVNGFYYGGDAIANAVQYYGVNNPTSAPITFTVSFTLDAYLASTLPQLNPLLSVSGSLFVYSGLNAIPLELPFGTGLGGDFATLTLADVDPLTGFATATRTVSFTVDPGNGFYLLAASSSSIAGYPEGNNLVDAYHTMTVNFTSGNTNLLTPQQAGLIVTTPPTTTVPEPSTWALMGAGLLTLAGASRRRIRSARAV